MNKLIYRAILVMVMVLTATSTVMSQRRARPGSMKHTSGAELENATKVTPGQATYIRNGACFSGPVYFTSSDGSEGIRIYTATLRFSNGKYTLALDAREFSTREAMTADDRARRGISDAQYDNMWKGEKLSEDIQQAGRYKVIKQGSVLHLILYDGDSDNVILRTNLSSKDTKYLEFKEDNLVCKLNFVK